jgi:hypothetical protein
MKEHQRHDFVEQQVAAIFDRAELIEQGLIATLRNVLGLSVEQLPERLNLDKVNADNVHQTLNNLYGFANTETFLGAALDALLERYIAAQPTADFALSVIKRYERSLRNGGEQCARRIMAAEGQQH